MNDQTGGFTWSRAVAEGTAHTLEQGLNGGAHFQALSSSGIFNRSCGGETNWFDFAKNS